MKKALVFACLVILGLSSCKKDLLDGLEKRTYIHSCNIPGINPELGCSGVLEIKPGNQASILPGGDIFFQATYKISGKKLTVSFGKTEFVFKILSDDELQLLSTGDIWAAK